MRNGNFTIVTVMFGSSCFAFPELLYKPTVQIVPTRDGVLVTIQPPSPAVSSATIVDYQLIISGSGIEETMVLNPAMR